MAEDKVSSLNMLRFFLKPYKFYLLILLGLCLINGLLETLHMALLYPILNASLESGGVGDTNLFFRIINQMAEVIPIDDVLISSCILFAVLTILYSASRLLYANLSPGSRPKLSENTSKKYSRNTLRRTIAFL